MSHAIRARLLAAKDALGRCANDELLQVSKIQALALVDEAVNPDAHLGARAEPGSEAADARLSVTVWPHCVLTRPGPSSQAMPQVRL